MRDTRYFCDYCGKEHVKLLGLTSLTIKLKGAEHYFMPEALHRNIQDVDVCREPCLPEVMRLFGEFIASIKSWSGKDKVVA